MLSITNFARRYASVYPAHVVAPPITARSHRKVQTSTKTPPSECHMSMPTHPVIAEPALFRAVTLLWIGFTKREHMQLTSADLYRTDTLPVAQPTESKH